MMIENVLYLPYIVGPIFMAAAGAMYFFPPKKINSLYGYRTGSSMESQEKWDFAQRHSAVRMFRAGAILFALSFLGMLFTFSVNAQLGIGIGLMLGVCVFLLSSTERAIKKKFPKS